MWCRTVLLVCAWAGVWAQTVRPHADPKGTTTTVVPILKHINELNEDGSYTYGFEAADGTFKLETRDALGNVKGKFGYTDSDGKLKVVEYAAGNGTGFETQSDVISGESTPPSFDTKLLSGPSRRIRRPTQRAKRPRTRPESQQVASSPSTAPSLLSSSDFSQPFPQTPHFQPTPHSQIPAEPQPHDGFTPQFNPQPTFRPQRLPKPTFRPQRLPKPRRDPQTPKPRPTFAPVSLPQPEKPQTQPTFRPRFRPQLPSHTDFDPRPTFGNRFTPQQDDFQPQPQPQDTFRPQFLPGTQPELTFTHQFPTKPQPESDPQPQPQPTFRPRFPSRPAFRPQPPVPQPPVFPKPQIPIEEPQQFLRRKADQDDDQDVEPQQLFTTPQFSSNPFPHFGARFPQAEQGSQQFSPPQSIPKTPQFPRRLPSDTGVGSSSRFPSSKNDGTSKKDEDKKASPFPSSQLQPSGVLPAGTFSISPTRRPQPVNLTPQRVPSNPQGTSFFSPQTPQFGGQEPPKFANGFSFGQQPTQFGQEPTHLFGQPKPERKPQFDRGTSSLGQGTPSFGLGASPASQGASQPGHASSFGQQPAFPQQPGQPSSFGQPVFPQQSVFVQKPQFFDQGFSLATPQQLTPDQVKQVQQQQPGQPASTFGQGPPQFGQGPPQFGQGPPQFGQGPPQFGQGSPQFGQGPPQFGQGAPQFGQGVPQFGQGVPQFGQGAPQFGQGVSQFGHGAPSFGQGVSQAGLDSSKFDTGALQPGQPRPLADRGATKFGLRPQAVQDTSQFDQDSSKSGQDPSKNNRGGTRFGRPRVGQRQFGQRRPQKTPQFGEETSPSTQKKPEVDKKPEPEQLPPPPQQPVFGQQQPPFLGQPILTQPFGQGFGSPAQLTPEQVKQIQQQQPGRFTPPLVLQQHNFPVHGFSGFPVPQRFTPQQRFGIPQPVFSPARPSNKDTDKQS